MTILEARRICKNFYRLSNPDEEDLFLFTEALDYLISETKNPRYMLELGSLYYERKQFDLARKYYEYAAEYNETGALLCLGYIWYYGRTGTQDYEKAFHYFDRASHRGDSNAAYKLADMYRRGLYVKQDMSKYRKIIEDLYLEFSHDSRYLHYPYSKLPEVYLRMGELMTEDGQAEKALELYDTARTLIARRIRDSAFFGDRTIMKDLTRKIYALRKMDYDCISLFDLYELLPEPCLIRFYYEGEIHEAEAVEEDGAVVIRFDRKWYRTVDDFFEKAQIGNALLTSLYEELYGFEVTKQ